MKQIRVENISISTSSDSLKNFFIQFGKIENISYNNNRTATISYNEYRDAKDAISLANGKVIDGNRISVSWERKRSASRSPSRRRSTSVSPPRVLSSSTSFSTELNRFGVYVGSNPVQLVQAEVKTKILNFLAEVSVTQTFVNSSQSSQESTFLFPIDDSTSAVFYFEIDIDGVKTIAKISEKNKAFEKYDNGIASGKTAALFENIKKDIFKISLGNLEPNKHVTITLKYASELSVSENSMEFRFPAMAIPMEEKSSLFHFFAELDLASEIRSDDIEMNLGGSDSTSIDGRKAIVKKKIGSAPNEDLILRIKGNNASKSTALVEIDEKGNKAIALSILPKLDEISEKQRTSEILFFLDSSGSMSGSKIKSVILAMNLFLRSLPMNILMNVISFASFYDCLFNESRELDEKAFDSACQFVNKLEAAGGTNLNKPLDKILSQERKANFRNVIILTDGVVSDPPTTLSVIREHCSDTKIFSFGIGSDVDKNFIQEIAKISGGRSEFIGDRDSLEQQATHYIAKALLPSITDISINWKGTSSSITQSPVRLPPICKNEVKMVYALLPYSENNILGTSVFITANGPTGKIQMEVPFEDIKAGKSTNFLISRLGARSLIRDLEEKTSVYHENGGLKKGLTSEFIESEILNISLKWSIVSSLTSFVTVSEVASEKAISESMELSEMSTHHNVIRDRNFDRDYDRGRSKEKEKSVSYQPKYRERSRSRSRSPKKWRPRERSRSPIKWNAKESENVRDRRRDNRDRDREKDTKRSRNRSRSRSPRRLRSPVARRSRSRSPINRRSRSRSPLARRSRSRSPINRRSRSRSPRRSPVARRSRSRSPNPENSKDTLIRLQNFNGSWNLSSQICEIVGLDLNSISKAIEAASSDPNIRATLKLQIATKNVIQYLKSSLGSQNKSLELLISKAESFLSSLGNLPPVSV